MSHPVTYPTTPSKIVLVTYTPDATVPTVYLTSKVKLKILPNIIPIIHYSFKHQVLLSQCDKLNISKNVVSHYSVSPRSMVMTGGQTY